MPTTMAGIVGASPTSRIGGIDITPQAVVIFAIALIVIVQIAGYIIG